MKLIVLGSSSKGNGYIISDSKGNALLLEAGMPAEDVRAAMLEHNVHIHSCLVSHKHGDHAKYVKDMMKMGIYVFAHPSVFENIHTPARYIQKIGENITIDTPDGYKLRFFPVNHDAPCFAFFITHAEGRIFFVTDTMYLRKILPENLTLAMVECNYDDETLQYNIEHNITTEAMRARLRMTHMELQTTVDMLTNTSGTKQIVLLHLSNDNSNPELMLNRVMSATAVPTVIAKPGLTLDF